MSDADSTVRNLLLLLLSATAGAVDVVSYVELGRVFTANMTGNTVLLGLALGRVEPQAITHSGLALIGFLLGVTIGMGLVGEPNADHRWTRWITLTIAIEALVLASVLVGWQRSGGALDGKPIQLVLVVFTAVAMGLQTAAVRDLAVDGIVTTYITGTLTNFVGRIVRRGQGKGAAVVQRPPDATWLLAGIWLVYVGSATGTAAVIKWAHGWALCGPLGLVMLVIGIAAVRFRKRLSQGEK